MRFEMMLITPEIAKKMLEKNINNRRLKKTAYKKYAEDMKLGYWEKGSPTPIIFGKNGELKDGQHRLMAVIESGKSIDFVVIYDVDDDVHIIDTGVKRSVGDNYKLATGEPLDKTVAAAVRLSISKGKRQKGERIIPSNVRIIEEYKSYEYLYLKALSICTVASRKPIARKAYILCAIKNALECGVDSNKLVDMFEVVNTGFSKCEYDFTAIVLRNWIYEQKRTSAEDYYIYQGIVEEYIRLYMNDISRVRRITKPTFYYENKKFEIKRRIKTNE